MPHHFYRQPKQFESSEQNYTKPEVFIIPTKGQGHNQRSISIHCFLGDQLLRQQDKYTNRKFIVDAHSNTYVWFRTCFITGFCLNRNDDKKIKKIFANCQLQIQTAIVTQPILSNDDPPF